MLPTKNIYIVLIACLGLFGLAAYSVEQRIKEVGIRKVSCQDIANSDFIFV
jgi:hypothetical protein